MYICIYIYIHRVLNTKMTFTSLSQAMKVISNNNISGNDTHTHTCACKSVSYKNNYDPNVSDGNVKMSTSNVRICQMRLQEVLTQLLKRNPIQPV